jgi:hypothetical protein
MSGRLPDARSNSLARQIGLICMPRLRSAERTLLAQNG